MRVWSSQTAQALGLRPMNPEGGLQPRTVWTVAALLQAISSAISARLPACTVSGELSAVSRPASGHLYFSLKDADGGAALVRCAMFRRSAGLLDFVPREGQRVQVRGRVGLYEPRGELQLVVESMQPAGDGSLYEQFLRLKARLEAEGLFAADRKRALPRLPRRVGVVTSLGAAALHDVCTALSRRAPQVQVIVYPAPVQGAEAPPALVQALATANLRREVDLLLLCRGGGSLEDLWAFNDERLVRAVASSAIPVVCGVGHETDFTLCDFAADLRAPTPTAAAELAVPSQSELLDDLAHRARRLVQAAQRQLDRQAQRLDQAAVRLSRPRSAVAREQRRLDHLETRLLAALQGAVQRRAQALDRLGLRQVAAVRQRRQQAVQRLELARSRWGLLNPLQVLDRGYALLVDADGRARSSVRDVAPGSTLTARLRDGRLTVEVSGREFEAGAPGTAPLGHQGP